MASDIEILREALQPGDTARKGDRVCYSARLYLRRGDEVTPDFEMIRRSGDRVPTRTVSGTRLIEHTITMGKRQPIAGIEKALATMTAGSFREVRIPPHLAYGARGVAERIPPNAILRAELWLHEIVPPQSHASAEDGNT